MNRARVRNHPSPFTFYSRGLGYVRIGLYIGWIFCCCVCDYDIFVLKSGVVHTRELAQRIYLMLDVNVPVDVIVETPKTFDELKDNPFLIYNEIAKYG